MVLGVGVLQREEVFVGIDFPKHYVFVIFVEMVFFTVIRAEVVLHILKSLSFEKYIYLVILNFHDVRAFAINEDYPIAKF